MTHFFSTRSIAFAAAGTLAALASTSAMAAGHGSPAGAPAVAADASTASDPAPRGDAKKICINRTPDGSSQVTGSILSYKVCKTRAQWEAAGAKFVAK